MLIRIYTLASYLVFFIAQPFSWIIPSLREFLVARESSLLRWQEGLSRVPKQDRIWFHVSSVGELEQVRPVLERLQNLGFTNILLSYFSPSVERVVRDFSFVAFADFLPLDFPKRMRAMMHLMKPRILVLNRYDLWPNHLAAAKEFGVPVVLINASTPPFSFLGRLGLFFRRFLFQGISYWTYVDSEAATEWEPYIRYDAKGLVAGNPRVDRAIRRVDEARQDPKLREKMKLWNHSKAQTVVAGSTWWEDEAVLLDAWEQIKSPERRLVIVPHEPTPEHLEKLTVELRRRGHTHIRYSRLLQKDDSEILVVDGRGFLAEIYGEGSVAYVGGGFTREIHSIIEPMAHESPVAFGPRCHRSPEAEALLALGSACRLKSVEQGAGDLAQWLLSMLSDTENSRRARESLRVFLKIHRGAGERVGDFLAECLRNSAMLKAGGESWEMKL